MPTLSPISFALPDSMTPMFTLGDLGEGHQLTRYEFGGVVWDFLARQLWSVALYREYDDVLVTYGPDDFDAPTVNVTNSTLTLTYVHPTTGTVVVIRGWTRESNGDLRLNGKVTTAGTDSSFSRYRIVFNLRIKMSAGSPEYVFFIPEYSGRLVSDPKSLYANFANPLTYAYPGFVFDDGAENNVVPTGFLLSMQLFSLYHRTEKTALLLRVNDYAGRTKQFKVTAGEIGGVDYLDFTLEAAPFNDRQETGTDWEMPYCLILTPMVGDWWDAAMFYQFTLRKEAPEFFNTPLSETKDLDIPANRSVMHIWGWDTIDSFATIEESIRRFGDFFGTYSFLYQIYGHGDDNEALGWPDLIDNMRPAALAHLQTLSDLGLDVGFYTFMYEVDPTGPAYAGSANPAWSDRLLVDYDGVPYSHTIGTGNDRNHYMIDIAFEDAVSSIISYYHAALTDQVTFPIGLIYFDTDGSRGSGLSYNQNLHQTLRGRGIAYFNVKRAFFQAARDAFGTGCCFIAEHPNEIAVRGIDILSTYTFSVFTPVTTYVPAFQTVFGRYVRFLDFSSAFGHADNGFGASQELEMWLHQFQYHHQMKLSYALRATPSVTTPPIVHWIPEEGDPYYESKLWRLEHAAFLKKLHVTGAPHFDKYRVRGQRLRTLPGSFEDHWGHTLIATFDPVTDSVKARALLDTEGLYTINDENNEPIYDERGPYVFPRVPEAISGFMVSAFISFEDENPSIGIAITNFRYNGTNTNFDLRMSVEDYPWLTGTHNVYLLNMVTGEKTLYTVTTDGLNIGVQCPWLEEVHLVIDGLNPLFGGVFIDPTSEIPPTQKVEELTIYDENYEPILDENSEPIYEA